MKNAVIVLGFGYGKHGTIGSQTLANLERGISLLDDLSAYEVPAELSFSGMAVIPGSSPQRLQEDLMYGHLYRLLTIKGLIRFYQIVCRTDDTPENRVIYNKTQGNALQIMHLAKKNGWEHVYIVDHPMHIPRLEIALEFMVMLSHANVDFVYVRSEIDSSNNAQSVAKYLPIYWVYERLTTIYQAFWLGTHIGQLRKALQ